MNAKDLLLQQVLLGSAIEVHGGQPQYRGIKGLLCNETRNMLWLSLSGVTYRVPKSSNKFLVNGTVLVPGDVLVGRFFDRLVK